MRGAVGRVNSYETEDLLRRLAEWGAHDRHLTLKILSECGFFLGPDYVLRSPEGESGEAALRSLAELLDKVYQKESSALVLAEGYQQIWLNDVEISGAFSEAEQWPTVSPGA